MSSKRSESNLIEPRTNAARAPSGASAALDVGFTRADARRAIAPASGWWDTAVANVPVPIALIAIVLLGLVVEGEWFGAYNQRVVMLIGFNIILAVSLQLINGFSGQFSLGHSGFMAVGAYLAAYPCLNYSQKLTDPATPLLFYLALAIVVAVIGALLLGVFLLIRQTVKLHPSLPAILMVVLLGWLVWDIYWASQSEIVPPYLVWSKSIELTRGGFAWMIDHGSPTAGKVAMLIPVAAREPMTFLVLVIGGGCCAAVVGFVVGLPTLRLRGDYLAIATLGLAEIIRIVIQNSQPLGGALGMIGIPKYTSFAWLYGAAAITIFVIWRVAYSARGRAIMAVREHEIAAAAVGIDTTRQKVSAFIIGAFFGGVAGALFALHERSITPGYFGLTKSIEIVVMVTLGGLGSISGAILAAIVLTLLPEMLRAISDYR